MSSSPESLDKVCENGHERIVYFGEDCPLCRIQDLLGRAQDQIDEALGGFTTTVTPVPEVKKEGKILHIKDYEGRRGFFATRTGAKPTIHEFPDHPDGAA
jgi:hypothetical protein